MLVKLSEAGSRMPQHAQPVPSHTYFESIFHRRHAFRPTVCNGAAAVPYARPVASAEASSAKGPPSGEQEFGSLQRRASSRLHRFYVPQPLGPTEETASLDALLSTTVPGSKPTPTSPPETTPAPSGASGTGTRSVGSGAAGAAVSSGASAAGAGPPPSVVLEGEEARHAARALRLQPGDRVELCDGRGNLVQGVVSGSDKQRVWVAPDGPCVHVPWRGSRWVVAVACTTLKGGRAEWLVEKLTELGAYMMVPLVTERSQAGGKAKFRTRGSGLRRTGGAAADGADDSDGDYQPGRLERVAIAATKQSLRPHALGLAPPTPLSDLLPLVSRASSLCGRTVDDSGGDYGGNSRGPACTSGNPVDEQPSSLSGGEGPPPGRGPREDTHTQRREGGGGGSDTAVVGGGGGRSFCLVAVAGAPPLASVLRELEEGRDRGALAARERELPSAVGCETELGAASRPGAEAHDGGCEVPVRVLFVGPEGDFTPSELAALVQAGARPVGLGTNRLRTETAAVGLLAACILTEDS